MIGVWQMLWWLLVVMLSSKPLQLATLKEEPELGAWMYGQAQFWSLLDVKIG